MNTIYCFWTGSNDMSDARKASLEQLKRVSECTVMLVTKDNLASYILPDHPLHPAYTYLSETHRADYLRTYFMHFHGGGYSDIKQTTGSWTNSFAKLVASPAWICGYAEVENGSAYNPTPDAWKELIGNGAYICKPKTPLTEEWYTTMMALLDTKLERLREHPSQFPQDCAERGTGYPIEWNEMLGRIFHRVCYKYKNYLLNSLPISIFYGYR
jgi:hypothetical protein